MADESKDEIFKIFFSADVVGSTKYKQPFEAGGAYSTSSEKKDTQSDQSKPELIESYEEILGRISNKKTDTWKNTIQDFYLQIDQQFKKQFRQMKILMFQKSLDLDVLDKTKSSKLMGDYPRIWKTIGDEVVFWKKVDCPEQVVFAIVCWMNALAAIRNNFEQTGVPLDIKATIWCGEFRRRNKAIVLDHFFEQQSKFDSDLDLRIKDESANEVDVKIQKYYRGENLSVVDFIGPAIDIGFRLAKFSSAKKMAISVDVAYLICKGTESIKKIANKSDEFRGFLTGQIKVDDNFEIKSFIKNNFNSLNEKDHCEIIPLHYSGSEQLKGVLGDIKYPFLWINTGFEDSLENVRDRLYLDDTGRRSVNVAQLRAYLDAFYGDRRDYILPPNLNTLT